MKMRFKMRMGMVALCMQMGGWGSVECVSGGKGGGGDQQHSFFPFFLVGVVFYIRKYLERNTIMQTVILHITEALSLISVEIQLLSRIQRIQPSENQFREF